MGSKNHIIAVVIMIVLILIGVNGYLYLNKIEKADTHPQNENTTTNQNSENTDNNGETTPEENINTENNNNDGATNGTPVVADISDEARVAECRDVLSSGKDSKTLENFQFYKDYIFAKNIDKKEVDSYVEIVSASDCSKVDEKNKMFCTKLKGSITDVKQEDFGEDPYPYHLIRSVLSKKDQCSELEDEGYASDCSNSYYILSSIVEAVNKGEKVSFDFTAFKKYLDEDFLARCEAWK